MKIYTVLVLVLVVAVPAIAEPQINPTTDIYQQQDTTQQENSAFNAPTSAMSNVQINPWGNSRDTYGGGVSCSKPTVNVGVAGGQSPHRALAYASINIPLGGGDCKRLAKLRGKTMEYELAQMKIEQRKADVLFSAKMAEMCLGIQRQITIDETNPLFSECEQYIRVEPDPDELAEIGVLMNRYDGIVRRVQTLEGVAHKPNDTNLFINR